MARKECTDCIFLAENTVREIRAGEETVILRKKCVCQDMRGRIISPRIECPYHKRRYTDGIAVPHLED